MQDVVNTNVVKKLVQVLCCKKVRFALLNLLLQDAPVVDNDALLLANLHSVTSRVCILKIRRIIDKNL
jgi:hypothetical protein